MGPGGAYGIGKTSCVSAKIGKIYIVYMYEVSIARLIPIVNLTLFPDIYITSDPVFFRAVTMYRYIDTYRYGLGRYRIDTLGCCIAILSDILLAANLVISNLKIYILNNSSTFYSISVNVRYLKQDQMDK